MTKGENIQIEQETFNHRVTLSYPVKKIYYSFRICNFFSRVGIQSG